jgi:hypothetical protein
LPCTRLACWVDLDLVAVGSGPEEAAIMSSTEPDEVPTEYPSSWRPAHIRKRDEANQPPDVERVLAAMDPAERAAMLRRIEAMQ